MSFFPRCRYCVYCQKTSSRTRNFPPNARSPRAYSLWPADAPTNAITPPTKEGLLNEEIKKSIPESSGVNELGRQNSGDNAESFDNYARELERRKRKTEAKRRQDGASFKDHLVITVRGGERCLHVQNYAFTWSLYEGKGGAGAAAFSPTRSGALGPPSGGNGGQGGSVYLSTSSQLTSLSTLRRRYVGGQGGNGSGDHRHGKRGEDMLLTVPIGTVVRETKRQGEEEKTWEEEEELDLDKESRRRRRWERVFVTHPGMGMEERDYKEAETRLRRERRFSNTTPTFEEDPAVIHDVEKEMIEPVLLARGSQGGLGNPFFANVSEYRAPRIASRGFQPYSSTFDLELKLLADVGLVGFPNAGKSTLLRGLTGRRAEVAGYEFTTLNPQVGVVRVWDDGSWGGGVGEEGDGSIVEESWRERERDDAAREKGEYIPLPRGPRFREKDQIEVSRFTISDNPGLLPHASDNIGLGHSFLRSIERSLALCFVLDITRPVPVSDLHVLRNELETYKAGLAEKGAVVLLNKGDEVDKAVGKERLESVQRAVKSLEGDMEVMVLSGKYGLGLGKLVKILAERLEVARREDQTKVQG